MPKTRVPFPDHRSRYSWNTAWWMARCCELVYVDAAGSNRPDDAAILDGLNGTSGKHFTNAEVFDAESSQAAVISHENFVVVAMRGTDEWADWLDNFNAWPTEVRYGNVHRGFKGATEALWGRMRPVIRRERRRTRDDGTRYDVPLWFTGHSLGGAMVTIAVSELLWADESFQGAYTFGQPRVGDRDFARKFNVECAGRYHRFQNNNDIVTRIPARAMGYSHVGSFLYITEKGELSSDPGWWARFLDGVQGVFEALQEDGIDPFGDHSIGKYRTAIENWGNKALV